MEKAVAVDMFPFTSGIETVALFEKCETDTKQEDKKISYREEEIPDCGCIYG